MRLFPAGLVLAVAVLFPLAAAPQDAGDDPSDAGFLGDSGWMAGPGGPGSLDPADPGGRDHWSPPDRAPGQHDVVDVDDLLEQLRGDDSGLDDPGGADPADLPGEIERAIHRPGGLPANTSETLSYEAEDFILIGLPVVIEVSGDWGEHRVECDLTFLFRRQATGQDQWQVSLSVWGGVFEAAYNYGRDTGYLNLANYIDSPLGDEPEPYVSGDFFINPQCGFGPENEPEAMMPGVIAALQQQHEACMMAYAQLGPFGVAEAAHNNAPPPAPCMVYATQQAGFAQSAGLSADGLGQLRDCIPDIAAGLGDERLVSSDCASILRTQGEQAQRAIGSCDLGGRSTGALDVFDPNPYAFTAIYRASYQRWDCRSYTVTAYINGAEGFRLFATLPQANSCLVVEPESPSFYLYFSGEVEEATEGALDDLVRLRAVGPGNLQVMSTVRQITPGQLMVTPLTPLEPARRYVLELRVGDDGIHSLAGVALEDWDVAQTMFDDMSPDPYWIAVARFAASPVSRNDGISGRARLETGIYQVSRDAQLLVRRPTAVRVWYDWDVPDPDPALWLTEFCARIDVAESGNPDAPLYPVHYGDIRLAEDYDAEERRLGRDSQNLFGWRPTDRIGSLEIAVSPRVYWQDLPGLAPAEPPRHIHDHPVSFLQDDPARIEYVVGFLDYRELGDHGWGDFLSVYRRQMENARLFTWQNMPVGDVGIRWVGGVPLAALGIVGDGLTAEQLGDRETIKAFYRTAAAAFGARYCPDTRQYCVLVVPALLDNHADTSRDGHRSIYLSHLILSASRERVDGTLPLSEDGTGLTHEFGHSLGLNHRPLRLEDSKDYENYETEAGIFPDIDGIRMGYAGAGGAIKSSDTGNSEAAAYLAPLMFPRLLGTDAQFIMNDNYDFLIDSIYRRGGEAELFGPESGNPRHRLETTSYSGISAELRRDSQGSFGPEGEGAGALTLIETLGRETTPAAAQGARPAVEGLTLGLVLLHGEAGAAPAFLHGLAATSAVPRGDYLDGQGPEFSLALLADGQELGRTRFSIRPVAGLQRNGGADIFTDLDLFLPLAPELRDRIDRIVLRGASGETLMETGIAALPDRIDHRTLADGTTEITWDAGAAAAALVTISAGGEEAALPIASASGGLFRLMPDEIGLSGPVQVGLHFGNGLASRDFALDLTLSPRFTSYGATELGAGPRPEILVAFNREPAADLPGFTLQDMASGEVAPLTAMAMGDRLILAPASDLPACGRFRIVVDGPLRDGEGQGLSGRAEWLLERGGVACLGGGAAPGADLVLTAGGRTQPLSGAVSRAAEDEFLLDLGALVVTLRAPGPGSHALIAVEPGPTRREITLVFGPGGSAPGELTLRSGAAGLTGALRAEWDGRSLDGVFLLPQ